jgi:hypothetical protein
MINFKYFQPFSNVNNSVIINHLHSFCFNYYRILQHSSTTTAQTHITYSRWIFRHIIKRTQLLYGISQTKTRRMIKREWNAQFTTTMRKGIVMWAGVRMENFRGISQMHTHEQHVAATCWRMPDGAWVCVNRSKIRQKKHTTFFFRSFAANWIIKWNKSRAIGARALIIKNLYVLLSAPFECLSLCDY